MSGMQQKSNYDLLCELRKSGSLNILFDSGFLSWKALFYLDVYEEYDLRIKVGDTKMEAIYKTAIRFDIDITTVYRILKKLGYENSGFDTNDRRKKKIS